MKEFKYGKFSPGLSGKTGPIVMLLAVLVFPCLAIAEGRSDFLPGTLILAVFFGVLFFGFSWWPNIKCDKESLYVEFAGWPIKIPREDILDIQEINHLPQRAWLVTAKKITYLHYFYSLLVSFRFTPGFMIWESISNRDELLSYIKKCKKK
jgi:hypothetical protein